MRLEDINLRNPITIAYYDPFSVFPSILDEFSSKFPLANLHWKYHPLKPGKSIPLLPVSLKEEVPPPQHKRHEKRPIFDNIYLRLMFVKADNMEMYRSQVRPLIKAWLESLVKDLNISWAIILITPGSIRDKPSTLIKTSIIDKLKIDFGKPGKHIEALNMAISDLESSKEDYENSEVGNILRIKDSYTNDIQKIQEYNAVVNQIKVLVLQTFDFRYNLYNDKINLLLNLSISDLGAQVSRFQYKLMLVYMMADMRFLKESFDLYNEVEHDLKVLVSNANIFDCKNVDFPSDLDINHFSPEAIFNTYEVLMQFAKYTQDNVPVNLFAAKLGLFLGVSLLLQSLANFASSISISAIYILTLLLKLNFFIHDISRSYPCGVQLNEWFCCLIDFYLNLPLTSKLMELDEKEKVNGGSSGIAAIKDCTAELRLLRRTIMGRLAIKRGLELPQIGFLLEDIPLVNENEANENFTPTYDPLVAPLQDQKSYEQYFETETIAAIEDFANSDRKKTIDLLSVDLAVLNYKRKEYGAALEILLTSHDYFIENGWNFMGAALLEIYLECIEKLNTSSHEDMLKTYLKLFSALKENSKKMGINNYNLIKSQLQRRKLYERICEEANLLEHSLSFPLSELFAISVECFIQSETCDHYTLMVNLDNPFAMELKFEDVRVTLESSNGNITFSASPVMVSAEHTQKIALHSRVFRKETFRVRKIEVQVGEKFTLVEEQLNDTVSVDNSVVHEDMNQLENLKQRNRTEKAKAIAMYPIPGNFRVEAISPKRIELGVARLDLEIHTGSQRAENLRISLLSLTQGVRFDHDVPNIVISLIDAESSLRKGVTFTYFGDSKVLDLQIDIVYESQGQEYEYHTNEEYDMGLIIAISVQDIFRSSAIYSKFLIGCASLKHPVRVLGCLFESPDDYFNITSLSIQLSESEPLIVFGEQPAFIFYKVEPRKELVSLTDILDLTITYSGLHDECIKMAQRHLYEKLRDMGLVKYYYLLLPTVMNFKFNLSHYAVNQEIEVLDIDECSLLMNEIVNDFVPERDARSMMDIGDIFRGNLTIGDVNTLVEHQILYIPVAVPFLDMFHQVEFVFDRKQRYLVGEPITAKLEIKSTSKWTNHESQEILASSSPTPETNSHDSNLFQFSVLGDDQWLLSGFKKHQFSVYGKSNASQFDICLVPLSVGELQLPRVNIKLLGSKELNMEIVHENALETILVVPELNSMTFSC